MRRYFFNLHDRSDIVLGPDGMLMSADAVAGAALLQARDCMAGEVAGGRLDLHSRIDVHDEAGIIIHSLAFGDALDFVPPR